MFQSILNFMQQTDRNGDWLGSDESESQYILDTIEQWIDDGLEVTQRIQGYRDHLHREIKKGG